MRITASDHNHHLQIPFHQAQGLNHCQAHIVRITAAHGHKHLAGSWHNLAFPFAPGGKFTPQHCKAKTEQQASVRFAIGIKLFSSVGVLIQHQIGEMMWGLSAVIHQQQFQVGTLESTLILDIKMIAINGYPVSRMGSDYPYDFLGVLLAPGNGG